MINSPDGYPHGHPPFEAAVEKGSQVREATAKKVDDFLKQMQHELRKRVFK